MGQKVSLTETFTGSGLPVVYDDSIMSAGSLILHDVGHSLGGFSGIPGNGASIPNVAWTTANGLVAGAPGQSALSSVISSSDTLVAGTTSSATFPFTERTPKNGLHIVRSQVNDLNGRQYLMNGASAIRDYLYNNQSHAFYFSVWQYFSRGATTRGSPYPGIACFGINTGNGFIALQPWEISNPSGSQQPSNTGHYIGYNCLGTLGLASSGGMGNSFWQGGVNSYVSTPPANNIATLCMPYVWGGSGGPFNAYPHAGFSSVFYRCYLEDLTVSAMAGGYAAANTISVSARFAEVAARDLALYTAAIANGGRFYDDTFANPNLYP